MRPLTNLSAARAAAGRRAGQLLIVLGSLAVVGILHPPGAACQSGGSGWPAFRINPDLPPDIVLNAGQGLGQCHYADTSIVGSPAVGWFYDADIGHSGWSSLEAEDGVFDWAPMDTLVAKARALGKRAWLELLTTEGATPQWAVDAGVPLVGSRGGTPAPWNQTYQGLLRRAVHAMAEHFDGDPTVDAIIVMAGGCYGEMSICAPHADRQVWEQAGYSDEAFVQAVKQIIDIYLEEEHVWEDGTRSHGFLKTPVVLQLGAGLYGHTVEVIAPVVEYAVSQYGMRVWLKYNSWGGNHDMGWLYQDYAGETRVGYEPAGNNADFLARPRSFVEAALDQHASFLCLQGTYFRTDSPEWTEARDLAARYLGTQIVLHSTELPPTLVAGQEYELVTHWENRGTVPPMRAVREGIRDAATTYEVAIALCEANGAKCALEQSLTPVVPTTQWHAGELIRLETVVHVPPTLAEGSYEVRIGLQNPDLPEQDERRFFRLIYVGAQDAAGRCILGESTVLHRTIMPTVPPAVAPTAVPEEDTGASTNWLVRLVQRLIAWLRGLFSGLRYFAQARPAA